MKDAFEGLLTRGLEALGLQNAPGLENRLEIYLKELALWNPKYGLVGTSDPGELVVKHLLDSLAPWNIIKTFHPKTLTDIGSGGGLPGIPLALALPEVKVTLIEKMGRRCRFLENLQALLGGTFEVVNADAGAVDRNFDLVTLRAVTPFEPSFTKILWDRVAPGGVLAAYKGRRSVLEDEIAGLGGEYGTPAIYELQVPFLDEPRCLAVFTKPV